MPQVKGYIYKKIYKKKKKKMRGISQMLSIFNLLIDLLFKSPILANDPFIYPDFKPNLIMPLGPSLPPQIPLDSFYSILSTVLLL